MSAFTLELEIERVERALERMLGVVGRRGYEILSVSAVTTSDDRYLVQLELSSERSPDVLARQLMKLHEVHQVRPSTA
jgi:acetolactate synthase regulatory subunit